jgi:hypothetical protein
MTKGEKEALIVHLELALLTLVDNHTNLGNIEEDSVDDILEDVYYILNDLDEVLSPTES